MFRSKTKKKCAKLFCNPKLCVKSVGICFGIELNEQETLKRIHLYGWMAKQTASVTFVRENQVCSNTHIHTFISE